jgi:hypothetical protein
MKLLLLLILFVLCWPLALLAIVLYPLFLAAIAAFPNRRHRG